MEIFNYQIFMPIIYAIFGGVIPTLIWLFFWEQEDRKHPEPKGMILIAFLGGAVAVIFSLFLEKAVFAIRPQDIFFSPIFEPIITWFSNLAISENLSLNKVFLVIISAPIIEEILKLIMAYILVLRTRDNDEPLDPVIYMITVALGFAAVESTLFLIDPFVNGDISFGVLTGNMRFLGATLLHTVSSAIIGFAIGFNFFSKRFHKIMIVSGSIILSILVHSLFNLFMIINNQNSIIILEVVWIAVIIVLLAFEKIKKIKLERI